MSDTLQKDLSPDSQGVMGVLNDITSGSAGGVLLVVLVLICYAFTSQFGFIWDDDAYIANNPLLRGTAGSSALSGLSRIWTEPGATPQYYPMTFTTFWLEVQAVGLSPKVSHVINFLLHAGSAVILWQILRKLAVPGAWLAAAVFAVHPMQVESVAWVSERKNTLSLFFGLVSVWVYLRYAGISLADTVAPPGNARFRLELPKEPGRIYGLFLLAFVLALLSKTTVAVLPLVLLAIIWWKHGRIGLKDVLPLLPALMLGAIAGSVTTWIEHNSRLVGAVGPEWNVPLIDRVALAGQTACWYAWKLIWPMPLMFNYPKWTLDAAQPLQWLPLAGVLLCVGLLVSFRQKLGRGPIVGLIIYLLLLAPASGFFMVYPMRYSWVADHFAYNASIALITLLVAGLAALVQHRAEGLRIGGAALAGVALAGFCTATVLHSTTFVNLDSLWKKTLTQNNKSWMAAISYGVYLNQRASELYDANMKFGDEAEAAKQRDEYRNGALRWTEVGIKRNPNAYEGYCNLGLIYIARGEYDAALKAFQTSDALADKLENRGYLQAKFAMWNLLTVMNRTPEANALRTELENAEPQYATRRPKPFAIMHTQMGDGILQSLKNPVSTHMTQEDRETLNSAMEQYIRAIELAPDFLPAQLKLAHILLDLDEVKASIDRINAVLEQDKNNIEAKFLIASAAVQSANYEVAAAQLSNILQAAPGFLPAHLRLAEAFYAMGRQADAVTELETTLKHAPDFTPAKDMLAHFRAAATQPSTPPLFAPSEAPPTH